jgi:hypothetical protein
MAKAGERTKYPLDEKDIPTHWYNVMAEAL